jgi:hypothetical protein
MDYKAARSSYSALPPKKIQSGFPEVSTREPHLSGTLSTIPDLVDFDLEFYQTMRAREGAHPPDPHYFQRQTTIRPPMRSQIVNWLVGVHRSMHLHTDTLFTAVELIDLTLSRVDFPKSSFQLLGCAALLLAAKGEELRPPNPDRLTRAAAHSITLRDLEDMQERIADTLQYQTTPLHSAHFLERFLRLTNSVTKLAMIAHFVNETALLDEAAIGILPSLRAAAAVALAMSLSGDRSRWADLMEGATGYVAADLQPVSDILLGCIRKFDGTECQAIHHKYSRAALGAVRELAFSESVRLE